MLSAQYLFSIFINDLVDSTPPSAHPTLFVDFLSVTVALGTEQVVTSIPGSVEYISKGSLSLRLLGSLRGSLGIYYIWFDTKIVLKQIILNLSRILAGSLLGMFHLVLCTPLFFISHLTSSFNGLSS